MPDQADFGPSPSTAPFEVHRFRPTRSARKDRIVFGGVRMMFWRCSEEFGCFPRFCELGLSTIIRVRMALAYC
eukprot:1839989-Alexandrium_andersonii.AAC.1